MEQKPPIFKISNKIKGPQETGFLSPIYNAGLTRSTSSKEV